MVWRKTLVSLLALRGGPPPKLLTTRPRIATLVAAANNNNLPQQPRPNLTPLTQPSTLATRAKEFLDDAPDPFHACEALRRRLDARGFTELDEARAWKGKLVPGGRYYWTRNRSCLVAFAVGSAYVPGNGFKVIGAHTDSPNLRIKPRSKREGAGGETVQLDVECYGGGLWHTWFDRDLSLSGRVVVRGANGGLEQRLVRIDRPLLRVPTLCIHLQSPKEREAFEVNKEDHLQPILAMAAKEALEGDGSIESGAVTAAAGGVEEVAGAAGAESAAVPGEWSSRQEPMLMRLLSEELGVPAEAIADFELSLYDTQPAAFSGANQEFLISARLDNLVSCFLATEALVAECGDGAAADAGGKPPSSEADVSLIALFDHEEVGSASATGAGSPIMGEAVRRITSALAAESAAPLASGAAEQHDLHASAISKSFVLSADMAHAVHPNYAAKHEKGHGPLMNKGLVIKSNSNQRYASNPITSFVVRELGRRAGLSPPQEFVVRNDCPCGSTIGPIISAATGMRAVDVGLPQLSMHSVREQMGALDLENGVDYFTAFFREFRSIDDELGAGS